MAGRVTVSDWKKDEDGQYIDVRIRPAKNAGLTSKKNAKLLVYDSFRLANGQRLAVTLTEPIE